MAPQLPLIERLHRAIGGTPSGFGSVSMPGIPLPETSHTTSAPVVEAAPGGVRTASGPSDGILAHLLLLRPESEQLRVRLAEMIGQLAPLLAEAKELAQQVEQERQDTLEAQHREVRKQGREQQAVCEQLTQEFQNAELNLQSAAAELENAVDHLRALTIMQQQNRHVGRWATDNELSEWRERVSKAKTRVIEANHAAVEALQARNEARERLSPAEGKLAELGATEIRLRKEIAGEAYHDPELGLSSVPSGMAR